MRQPTHRITVVSEGLLFEGYRVPCAFVWRAAGAVPANPARELKPTAHQIEYALEYLRKANLSKEDKAKCRRQVASMSGPEVQRLSAELRRFHSSSSSQ